MRLFEPTHARLLATVHTGKRASGPRFCSPAAPPRAKQTHFSSISAFFSSSELGLPICFCCWSNIILRTMAPVSSSSSLTCTRARGRRASAVSEQPTAVPARARTKRRRTYLGVFRLDFARVEERLGRDDARPPLHGVDLKEGDAQHCAVTRRTVPSAATVRQTHRPTRCGREVLES